MKQGHRFRAPGLPPALLPRTLSEGRASLVSSDLRGYSPHQQAGQQPLPDPEALLDFPVSFPSGGSFVLLS